MWRSKETGCSLLSGASGAEPRKNLEIQWDAAFPYVAKLWGDEADAARKVGRLFAYFDRPDTFSTCNLYFVTARVPEG